MYKFTHTSQVPNQFSASPPSDTPPQYIFSPTATKTGEKVNDGSASGDDKVENNGTAHCFLLPELLSREECRYLIETSESYGYSGLESEYPSNYRNSERVIVLSEVWKSWIWKRFQARLNNHHSKNTSSTTAAENHVFDEKTVENQGNKTKESSFNWHVKPFGFDNNGHWRCVGLNECFRFSKYEKEQYFKPHIDGMFVRNRNERSIFSLIIYLNDEYEGGELELYSMKDRSRVTNLNESVSGGNDANGKDDDSKFKCLNKLKVKAGTAVVFNQDLPHCGASITQGTKYIVRTDVMFRRVAMKSFPSTNHHLHGGDSSSLLQPYDFESSEQYRQAMQLLLKSDEMERVGNVEEATKLYLQAQALQAQFSSASHVEEREISMVETLPEDALMHALEYMLPGDAMRLMMCNRYYYQTCQNPRIWHQYYNGKWPSGEHGTVDKMELYNDDGGGDDDAQPMGANSKLNPLTVNWYHCFKSRAMYSVNFRAIVVSLDEKTINYGYLDGEQQSMPMKIGRPNHPHFSMAGFGRDDYLVGDIAAQCYHISDESIFDANTINVPLLEQVMDYVLYRKMKVDPSNHPIVFTISPAVNANTLDDIASLFFDNYQVPALRFIEQPTAYAAALGIESGFFVTYDNHEASCSAIQNGQFVKKGFFSSTFNRSSIRSFVKQSISDCGVRWVGSNRIAEVFTNMYAAQNYEEELKTVPPVHLSPDYYSNGSSIPVPLVAIKATEILFRPQLILEEEANGVSDQPGIVELIVRSIQAVWADAENTSSAASASSNQQDHFIVLYGSIFGLPRVIDRLTTELRKHLTHFSLHPIEWQEYNEEDNEQWKRGTDLWKGAKYHSNLSTFKDTCTTVLQFRSNNDSMHLRK